MREPNTYTEEFFYNFGFEPDLLDQADTVEKLRFCLDLLIAHHVAYDKDYSDFLDIVGRRTSYIFSRLEKLEKAAKRHEWARKRGMKLH